MDCPSILFVVFLATLLIHIAKGYSCEVNVEKVGCFNDQSRPLDKLLVWRRTTYNHEGQKTTLPRLLCDCAVKAQLKGYSYIGLQYYAECWTSSESQPKYGRDGPAGKGKCVNAEFRPCFHNDTVCVGGSRANFIYKIVDADKTSSEVKGTPASTTSAAQPGTTQSTTRMQLFQNNVAMHTSAATFQVTEPSESSKSPSEDKLSTMVPVTESNPPCVDKQSRCADFISYCSDAYPFMLKQCPKTCQLCT